MEHTVHLALQIVPISRLPAYPIIDHAIQAIAQSGLPYVVGPMETVVQGTYPEVMAVAEKAQQAAFEAGADELVVTLKVHWRKAGPVRFEEKGLHRKHPAPPGPENF